MRNAVSKNILLPVFFFLTALLLSQNFPPEKIYYTNQVPRIDGNFDDWDTTGAYKFNVIDQNNRIGSRAEVKFLWDEDNLYGLYIVYDKNLIRLEEGNDNPRLYFNDAIELYIDTKNDSYYRMNLNDYQFLIDVTGDETIFKGDKQKIELEAVVPKDYGTANIVFNSAAKYIGTINKTDDADSMYCVEFSIAWSSIGIRPHSNLKLRMDVCIDDMDNLVDLSKIPEGQPIDNYYFASWKGSRDFGFPKQWQSIELAGSASFFTTLSKQYSKEWLLLFFITLIFSGGIVILLSLKIKRLKIIPQKASIENSLLELIVTRKDNQKYESPHSAMIKYLRDYIEKSISENIRPENLAQHAKCSLRQLQRIFKEELNSNPGNFIVLIKLEKAAEMLLKGNKNITEIAFELGFASSSYFTQVFKKYFEKTPKEFIKANRPIAPPKN